MHCKKPGSSPLGRLCGAAILAAIVFVVLVVLMGCGKKEWPRPAETEEGFRFTSVTGLLQDSCLTVKAEIAGNWRNMDSVSLELADAADCPECPFKAAQTITLSRTETPELFAAGPRISLAYCELPPGEPVRWRLSATNAEPHAEGAVSLDTITR
ncbi:MAG: hypothetical protein AB7E47_11095 [Desulfovibrionaceae bacterium]